MSERRRSVAEWIAAARQAFTLGGLDDPATDARVLVSGVLQLSATQAMLQADRMPSEIEAESLAVAIGRRLKREPVHRILGMREFYGIDLQLSAETLEPRPDTEILVDQILALLPEIVRENGAVRVLDLGTGTGAIALSVLKNCPEATAVGSDISTDALATARSNAEINGVADRFQPVHSHWFDAIDARFDVILSNPPYIRSAVIPELSPEVRLYDPIVALDGGDDGLDAYRAIASTAEDFLTPGGWVGVEIGYDQKGDVSKIFTDAGFTLAQSASDYGGQDRVLIFRGRAS